METKPFYKSKLVWLGILLFLMGAVPVLQELFAGGGIDVDKALTAIGGLLAVVFRV
uniref:Holin n=1 Tax=viral metagenome TaxID=1070528 RepID=A0A6H1Z9C9_9ZZZZ